MTPKFQAELGEPTKVPCPSCPHAVYLPCEACGVEGVRDEATKLCRPCWRCWVFVDMCIREEKAEQKP